MQRLVWVFLLFMPGFAFADEGPLHLAPGPIDNLLADRGWQSSDSPPTRAEEAPPPVADPDVPDALSAGLHEAARIERLEQGRRGIYLDTRGGFVRVDNAGEGHRFVGTGTFAPLTGDFVLEFEMTAALVGSAPAMFGLADRPEAVSTAGHALFIEYGAIEHRKPILRWMARTPQTGLKELGRFHPVGWVADKLIRMARQGDRLSLTVQQDHLIEATLQTDLPGSGSFTWLGADFSSPVTAKRGQRTIVLIDNIHGLDPQLPSPAQPSEETSFPFPDSPETHWPPRILVGGLDVLSREYAYHAGLPRPLELKPADLSEAKAGPNPGTVAYDARMKRIRFSGGLGRPIRRIGSLDLLRGTPRHIVVKHPFLYLAHGDGSPRSHLVILDISQPKAPKVASALPIAWWPEDLEVAGDIAYVPDGMTLHLVDVKDPYAPRVIGKYEQDLGMEKGEARCVAVQGHFMFLAVAKRGLIVLDVSQPSSPTLVGMASHPSLRGPTDLLVEGEFVWMASEEGLQIYDVSKPERPVLVRSGSAARPSQDSQDDGSAGFGGEDGEEASKTVSLKDYEIVRQPLRLFRADPYLFVVDKREGLVIFDVSHPLNPEVMGRYQPFSGRNVPGLEVHATSVCVVGQTAFLTVNHGFAPQRLEFEEAPMAVDLGGGVLVLNVEDPLEPVLMGRYVERDFFTNYVDVAAHGSQVYVSDASYGVWSLDVSDERQPRLLGGVPTQGDVREMAIEGSVAYLASALGQGVFAVDISSPASPKILGHYHTGFDAPSLVAKEGMVYLGCRDWSVPYGLQAINFRDPQHPVRVGSAPASPAYQWMDCGEWLYSSSGEVFDLTDPFHPEAYGKLPSGALLRSDQLFFIAHPNVKEGLLILDTSRSGDGVVAGKLPVYLDSSGRGALALRANTLFIAGGAEGVAIVDIENLSKPQLLKKLKGNIGCAVDVSVYGRFLCVTDLYEGIKLYDARQPWQPRLKAIYPLKGEEVFPTGYRSIFRDGLLYRARLDGLDILEMPLPSEAPLEKVTLQPGGS